MSLRRPVICMVRLGQVVQRPGLLTPGSESFHFTKVLGNQSWLDVKGRESGVFEKKSLQFLENGFC